MTSHTTADRAPLATCFGGGGAFGYGFAMGIADGLRERGLEIGRHPIIGTSAGAHAAATIDTDLTFERVADLWQRYVEAQGFRVSRGIDLAGPIYRDRGGTDIGAVAVRLLGLRRRVLSADDHPLADIVAASSSVPPLVRPHRLDGKRYLDGGVVSLTSADLAPAANLLLLVTPFALPQQGIPGRVGRFQTKREIRKWVAEHGGSVLQVVPTPEMATLGGQRLRDVGDMTIGRAVYPLALVLGRQVADVVRADHLHLFTDSIDTDDRSPVAAGGG